MDRGPESGRSDALAYDALAADPKVLAVLDTVRRVVGLPTGSTRTTFAPAQVARPQAAPAPDQGRSEGAPRPPAEVRPKRPPRREVPVAASLGPSARRRVAPASVRPAPQDLRSGPPRGLLFGGIAALLLHLAVFLALGGGEPVLSADAGPVGTIIGALIERAGSPT